MSFERKDAQMNCSKILEIWCTYRIAVYGVFGIVENKIIARKRTDGLKNLVGSFKISNKVTVTGLSKRHNNNSVTQEN